MICMICLRCGADGGGSGGGSSDGSGGRCAKRTGGGGHAYVLYVDRSGLITTVGLSGSRGFCSRTDGPSSAQKNGFN